MVREGRRLGYTTGSCAAAAAKAASWMLLTGRERRYVTLTVPKGLTLELELRDIRRGEEFVSCAVEKDSGDDPDVTRGTLIYARVSRTEMPGIAIDGGAGIGRVTRRGLDQPVGAAAINSVPREMIRTNLEEVCRLTGYPGGLSVVISAPEGAALAQKTFNPRLGIQGGISILGTTGIVEPMSEQALVDTIRVELRQRRAEGQDYVLLTPGNYGCDFIRQTLSLDPAAAVQVSNFIGEALDLCRELGFRGALLVGHIGKLTKVAGGMLNTHSRYGECRMEILAAQGGAAGLSPAGIREVLGCVACDDALRVLRENGVYEAALSRLLERIGYHLARRGGELETGAMVFSKEYGLLGETGGARALLARAEAGRAPEGRREHG